MPRTISNSDDVIDSRDVIARVEELRETLFDQHQEEGGCESEFDAWLSHQDNADAEELATLEALAEEAEDYAADWEHGETLIRDSYFKTYAMELAEDCGMISGTETWPLNCIDWDKAARELQMGYTSIEFDGVTYWTR
jgi:hypothetical protein